MDLVFFILLSFLFPYIITVNMIVTNVIFPKNCNKYFKGTYQFNISLSCPECSNTNPSIEDDIELSLQDGKVETSLNATCNIKNTSTTMTNATCRLTSISRSYPINLLEQNAIGTNVNITVPETISKIKSNTTIGVIIDVWKTSERQFIDNMIENTELGRVFSLFFENDIYQKNISSLYATNESNIVYFNLSKCTYTETQLTCRPNQGTLLGDSRKPKDIFTYHVYYVDDCGEKDTGVILQVNDSVFLKWNFFIVFLIFILEFL